MGNVGCRVAKLSSRGTGPELNSGTSGSQSHSPSTSPLSVVRVIFPKDGVVTTACHLNSPRVLIGDRRKPQLTGDIEGRCSQLLVTFALSALLNGAGELGLHSALLDPRAGAYAGSPFPYPEHPSRLPHPSRSFTFPLLSNLQQASAPRPPFFLSIMNISPPSPLRKPGLYLQR